VRLPGLRFPPPRRVLFDLDGTLSDPRPGITGAVQHALTRMGIVEADPARLTGFIGPPLGLSFERYYGLGEAAARVAVEHYREYFGTRGLYENALYPGIAGLLAELQERGTRLALVTVKPTRYAERILEHFRIARHFEAMVGTEMSELRASKEQIVGDGLRRLGGADGAVVVGDREDDVKAARRHGVPSVGVAYGYGGRDELERAAPTLVVDSVAELRETLCSTVWTARPSIPSVEP
jgi:phosphoglycolate phosphatase